jgi:hypothetical protein
MTCSKRGTEYKFLAGQRRHTKEGLGWIRKKLCVIALHNIAKHYANDLLASIPETRQFGIGLAEYSKEKCVIVTNYVEYWRLAFDLYVPEIREWLS